MSYDAVIALGLLLALGVLYAVDSSMRKFILGCVIMLSWFLIVIFSAAILYSFFHKLV